MNGLERERFCGVLFSCCPTLCSTKYLVYSIVIISGSMLLIFDQPALIILLVKLLGIYFKNLFICIDEFIIQVPDNLKS